ncbi:TIGR01212 family radical SAM protein [Serpentinicella sp. ANB-PHB4]|nr:TIGR01212 family radical SAM protein [Serpentinicella sp. ANB-PHB4]MDR5658532.1 TIGR01212 family radical SAM protein [Serpentinicella sp. ANB-PHB4]
MLDTKERYNIYSKHLKQKYGEKVYKLPINLPVTCPNRDGKKGTGGCTFCAEVGAGFENLSDTLSVKEQIEKNMNYISRRYKANKFIAYFQNYTNTYMPLDQFKKYIKEAVVDNVVEIAISTRPDCIDEMYLAYLKEIKEAYDIEITIELGLQTVNYHSLKKVNRGHTLAEFIDAVLKIKKYGFEMCVHLILNLPWDNMDDVIENAKILSVLEVEQVKLHALYIMNDTKLGEQYKHGDIEMITVDQYVDRVITFLEHLSPKIVVQRLIGRAPEENSLFVNWNMSWWKIKDLIDHNLEARDSYQGKQFRK